MSNFATVKSPYNLPNEVRLLDRLDAKSPPQVISGAFSNSGKPSSRRRGVVLTQRGWQKLMQAEVLYDDFGKRYTHEELSEKSLLDVRTISRILSCEVRVDKRTLKTFFYAFNLRLDLDDYTIPQHGVVGARLGTLHYSSLEQTQTNSSTEEIMQLKQQIMQSYSRLLDLLGLDQGSDNFRELSKLIPQE
ncbi:hypothetical protein IFO70_24200 [Phormidium tenue FACHB-886]|nr:hypothetical protein [Phormidium tenue FACHB-886]